MIIANNETQKPTSKKEPRWQPFSRAQWITVDREPIAMDIRRGSFSIMILTKSEWHFSIANMNGFMSELSEALVSAPLRNEEKFEVAIKIIGVSMSEPHITVFSLQKRTLYN